MDRELKVEEKDKKPNNEKEIIRRVDTVSAYSNERRVKIIIS